MSAPPSGSVLALALARRWVHWYTARVTAESSERRRAEIESDLWDQNADAQRSGVPACVVQASIARRVLAGVPADLVWAYEQRSPSARPPRWALARGLERRGRTVAAGILVAFYAWVAVVSLPHPEQPAGLLVVGLATTALLLGGALPARRPWLRAAALALGAAPAMLVWWAPGIPAVAVAVAASALAAAANLTIGASRACRGVAATAGVTLVLVSFGVVALGWGTHWPVAGLVSTLVIALTLRRRPPIPDQGPSLRVDGVA